MNDETVADGSVREIHRRFPSRALNADSAAEFLVLRHRGA